MVGSVLPLYTFSVWKELITPQHNDVKIGLGLLSQYVQPIIVQVFPSLAETLSVGSVQDGCATDGDAEFTYCDAADDGGAHEVAALVSLDVDVSAVEQQLGSLVDAALDQAAHPLLGLGGDQRPNICARLVS